MKFNRLLSLTSSLAASLSVSSALLGQDLTQAKPLQPNEKAGHNSKLTLSKSLERYHKILLKRPESSSLFQKFQEKWLLESNGGQANTEEGLVQFLKANAEAAKASKSTEVAHYQLYSYLLLKLGDDLKAKK